MKIFILTLTLMLSLNADEMQRIENIVNDIAKLRVDYEMCQNKLMLKSADKLELKAVECDNDEIVDEYKKFLEDEKQKSAVLHKEIEEFNNISKQNSELQLKIQELENRVKKFENTIENQENILKTKDNTIKNLKAKNSEKVIIKENNSSSLKKAIVICEPRKEENSFPKLLMKEQVSKDIELKKEVSQDVEIKEKTIFIKAGTYKLKEDSEIYSAINGEKISIWNKNKTFTSNIRSENWIKITGYFTDKQWKSSELEMWIRIEKVNKK